MYINTAYCALGDTHSNLFIKNIAKRCMLRDVKPFDAKQWKQLQDEQRNGPSAEQLKKIAVSKKRMENMPALNF